MEYRELTPEESKKYQKMVKKSAKMMKIGSDLILKAQNMINNYRVKNSITWVSKEGLRKKV